MRRRQGSITVKVLKGINLAVRDTSSSDPYAVVIVGREKAKTHVIKKNLNPEWREDLTFPVYESVGTIKLAVYDWDRFCDDPMGDAEIDIEPFMEAVYVNAKVLGEGSTIRKLPPTMRNCYAEESRIYYQNGRVTQDAVLRLRNVECGWLEVQLLWG